MVPLRVFVVDDDVDFARALSTLLEIEGHDVEVAFSGEQAMEVLRQDDFDITFMDVRLPGMSGVESFLEVRKSRPHTKVVMMTAYSVEELLTKAMEAGALGVLRKPFDTEEILETLEAAKPDGFVLLADDDPDFIASTASFLRSSGFKVILARSGEEAIQQALSNGIDALILDQRLSLLNGMEVYVELKRLGRNVPTLIIAAYAREAGERGEGLKRARDLSVAGVLPKAFEPAELLQILEQMIDAPGKKVN